jgi:uncharacterized protein
MFPFGRLPGQAANHTVGKSFHISFDGDKCISGTDSVRRIKGCPTSAGTLGAMAEPLDEATLDYAHRMFDLARSGVTDELADQLAEGLPANLTNDKGDTLLILAAYHNHPATVRALLEAGADPARVNDRGQTALAAAVFRKNSETIATLLAAGANPHDGNPSAIATAEFFDLPEMLELLRS